jgi:hypothetical protein
MENPFFVVCFVVACGCSLVGLRLTIRRQHQADRPTRPARATPLVLPPMVTRSGSTALPLRQREPLQTCPTCRRREPDPQATFCGSCGSMLGAHAGDDATRGTAGSSPSLPSR